MNNQLDMTLGHLLDTDSDDLRSQGFFLRAIVEDTDDKRMVTACHVAYANIDLVENFAVGKGVVYDVDDKGILKSGIDLGYSHYNYILVHEDTPEVVSFNNYKESISDILFRIKDGGIFRVSLHSRRNSCIKTGSDSMDRKEINFWYMEGDQHFKAHDRAGLVGMTDCDSFVNFTEVMTESTILADVTEGVGESFMVYLDTLTNVVTMRNFTDITEVIDLALNNIVLEIAP